MEKIGIMGGTFDPIHYAHLILGEQSLLQLGLDRILFIPTGDPPHKADKKVSSASHRLEMTRLAIAGNTSFQLSDLEVLMGGKSYTAKTLKELSIRYPEAVFYFIMGGDSLAYVDKWHEPEEIFRRAVIVAAVRDEVDADQVKELSEKLIRRYGGEIHLLAIPSMDISSEFLRMKIANGESVRYYIPDEVRKYINEHQLYQ